MKTIKHCKDCEKKLSKTAIVNGANYCRKCVEKYKKYPSRKGKNNPSYKDGHTIMKYYCNSCNKEIGWNCAINGTHLCHSCAQTERLKDPKNHPMFGNERRDLQILFRGKGNPMWEGGISDNPYPLEWSKRLKAKIRDRDNHECQICHIKEKYLDRLLHIHHIDYNKENSIEENLISLCHRCHIKTNANRDYYYAYFIAIIEQLYGKLTQGGMYGSK
jgi:hypothetical protein